MNSRQTPLFSIPLPDVIEGKEAFDGIKEIRIEKREVTRMVNEMLIALQDFQTGYSALHPDTTPEQASYQRMNELNALMAPFCTLANHLLDDPKPFGNTDEYDHSKQVDEIQDLLGDIKSESIQVEKTAYGWTE